MVWKPLFHRCFWFACAGLILTGCQEQEQIRSYDVPKEPPPAVKKQGGAAFAGARPFRFTKPDAWEEQRPDNPKGIARAAVFLVRDGEKRAEVSVVPLAGLGGGASANVNRWRRQLGLEPLDDAAIEKQLRHLETAAGKAPYVDLTGPDQAGGQRILGAWIVHGGKTWFIKMMGSSPLVGKQQAAFEGFVQSIRFGDGQGAAHE